MDDIRSLCTYPGKICWKSEQKHGFCISVVCEVCDSILVHALYRMPKTNAYLAGYICLPSRVRSEFAYQSMTELDIVVVDVCQPIKSRFI